MSNRPLRTGLVFACLFLGWAFLLFAGNFQHFPEIGCLKAQVPGYLGKRVSLFYNPAIGVGFNTSYRKFSPTGPYPKMNQGAEVDYVVSRVSTVGASYQFFKSGKEIKSPFTFRLVHGRIEGHGVGAYMKFFPYTKRGNIAPLGPYTKIEYMFLFYSLKEKEGNYFSDGGGGKIGNYYTSALFLSIGQNHLFWDFLFLHYGLQGGFVVGMLNPQDPGDPTRFGPVLHDRLAAYFALNLKMGMGFLLF